ncbi:MAG: hypothetical protein FJY97_16095 [candidate division Zixibacteria bacterium]|nr:hypothetical protein [candidate division Zixibacteria bacterium]
MNRLFRPCGNSVQQFILIGILQQGVLAWIGVVSSASTIVPGGLTGIQSIGGLIVFVLIGLWMSRRHLIEVGRKTLGRSSTLRNEDELISYRTAVIGFLVGLIYVGCWMSRAGMSLPVIVFLLFFLYVFYVWINNATQVTALELSFLASIGAFWALPPRHGRHLRYGFFIPEESPR